MGDAHISHQCLMLRLSTATLWSGAARNMWGWGVNCQVGRDAQHVGEGCELSGREGYTTGGGGVCTVR